MKLLYKTLMLLALARGYVLLACGGSPVHSAPFVYARLFTMFLAGAVLALFVQGPEYGAIDPISSRPSAPGPMRSTFIVLQVVVTSFIVWKLASGLWLGLFWASTSLAGMLQSLWLRYRRPVPGTA